MRRVVFLSAVIMMLTATANADTYDPGTNQLTIDSIQLGDTIYTDVVITVANVISVGGSRAAASTVAAICSAENFTTSAFNAIQLGMSVDQVNEAIGCEYDPSWTQRGSDYVFYTWRVNQAYPIVNISVYFDPSGTAVALPASFDPGAPFKTSIGF